MGDKLAQSDFDMKVRAILDGIAAAPTESKAVWCAEFNARTLMALAHYRAGVACPACQGHGRRTYGDTSTWRGGIGGQAITEGVCDKCWGSGRTDETGVDQRKMAGSFAAERALADRLAEQLKASQFDGRVLDGDWICTECGGASRHRDDCARAAALAKHAERREE